MTAALAASKRGESFNGHQHSPSTLARAVVHLEHQYKEMQAEYLGYEEYTPEGDEP